MVKYWLRLTTDWEFFPLPQRSLPGFFKDSPWAAHIKKGLEGAGFAEIWVNPDIYKLLKET